MPTALPLGTRVAFIADERVTGIVVGYGTVDNALDPSSTDDRVHHVVIVALAATCPRPNWGVSHHPFDESVLKVIEPELPALIPHPLLSLTRNNAGQTFIGLTEFNEDFEAMRTCVLSMATDGMPVDSVMRRIFGDLARLIPCTTEDLLPDAAS